MSVARTSDLAVVRGPVGHDHVFVDWMTFSHPKEEDLYQFLHGELTAVRPWWPYKWALEDGDGVKLLGGGPEGRPFLLDVRGEALRRRRAAGLDDFGTVAMAAFNGLRCTRLDLARDVTSHLTPAWLWRARTENRTVSLWRRWKWIDEGGTGQMVRCGGKESQSALRVYDKRAELLQAKQRCPFPRLTRWELVLRGKRAHAAFLYLAEVAQTTDEETGAESWPIHRPWCSWVRNLLTVTSLPVDRANKHQGRGDIAHDWATFLAATDASVLNSDVATLAPAERAARLVRWFRTACGPSLHVIAKLVGWVRVHDLARRCHGRVNSGHRALITSHLHEARAGAAAALAPRRRPRRGRTAVVTS